MGLGSVSWDILIPSCVRLLVVFLVVVWPIVSDMPIYDGFLNVYAFCMLHRAVRVEESQVCATPQLLRLWS
jgi:hypothetical protein